MTQGTKPRSPYRLLLYGLLMLLPLAYFVRRYPLRGHLRLSDIGHLSGYGRPEFVLYLGGMTALFVLYLLALRETRKLPVRSALPVALGGGAVMSAVMSPMYPATAVDIFVYVVRSRIFTTYGDNPMAMYARSYESDPLIRSLSGEWSFHPSPYGPLWNLVAAPITYFADTNLGLAIAGFKFLSIVCLLAGGIVIALILARARPQDAATGALFYLWNPLVIWEVAGNGHNDTVMVLPMLLAFLAWSRRRDAWVLPLLGMAVLIKFVAVLLLPLAIIALWRRTNNWQERGALALRTGILSMLVLLVSFYPFYDLQAVRDSVADTNKIFVVSPANMVVHWFRDSYPAEDLKRWLKAAGWVILLASMAWHSRVVWRGGDLARASFEVFYVFLIIVTTYFQGWYLIWPLALTALLPWGWPAARMIAWTIGAMAVYALFIWVRRWWIPDGVVLLRIGIPIISGASALLTLAEVISRRPRNRQKLGQESLQGRRTEGLRTPQAGT